MRKKIVKGTVELVGMSLVLSGLIVCMCETKMDKQLTSMFIGLGMIFAGAVVAALVNRGEEDELS